MRALVTGGAGFIGRRLVGRLRDAGWAVLVTTRGEASLAGDAVRLDLRRDLGWHEAMRDVDVVFHLASRVHIADGPGEDARHEEVTLQGTRRVVEAATRASVGRIVFMSTVAVHGHGSAAAVDEMAPLAPETAYARAKVGAEESVRAAAAGGGPSFAILRPPMVYGVGAPGNLTRMAKAIRQGWFPPLPDLGGERDMLHVENLVDVLVAAADSSSSGSYIITDHAPYRTRAIYDGLRSALGLRPARFTVPAGLLRGCAHAGDALGARLGRPPIFGAHQLERLLGSARFDGGRARSELGVSPKRELFECLPAIVAAL